MSDQGGNTNDEPDQGRYDQGYHAGLEDSMGKLAETLRLHMQGGESEISEDQARQIFEAVFGIAAANDEFGQPPAGGDSPGGSVHQLYP